MVYVSKGVDWHATTQDPRPALELGLTDVASATVWIQRTNLEDWNFTLHWNTNVPSSITFVLDEDNTRTVTLAGKGSMDL